MENISLKGSKLIESPKDTVLDGIIIAIKQAKFSEILQNLSEEKKAKFDNLDQERVIFEFETAYKGRNIKGSTHVALYPLDAIPDSSNLGKIRAKYGENIDVGTEVKIDFDENGIASLRF